MAANEQTAIRLSEMGFAGGVTREGSAPSFSLYLPVYHSLRAVHVHAPLSFSSSVDPQSPVWIHLGDDTVLSTTVKALHTRALDLTIPRARLGNASGVWISIGAHLFVDRAQCRFTTPSALWLRIAPETHLTLTLNDTPRTLAEYLHTYRGTYAIVEAHNPSQAVRRLAVALAYWLHQEERWRSVTISRTAHPFAGARRIVLADNGSDFALKNGALHLTPRGATAFSRLIAPPLVATTQAVTLDDLGVKTQPRTGTGMMRIEAPVALASLGTLPSHLEARVALSNTPDDADGHTTVRLGMNDGPVTVATLNPQGGTQTFTVLLDPRTLRAMNTLTVDAQYDPAHASCGPSISSTTLRLLGPTTLSWSGSGSPPFSISQFTGLFMGRIAVLIGDRSLNDGAFALLDRLGALGGGVRSIDVQPFSGIVPSGYDRVIIFASPTQLRAVHIDEPDAPFGAFHVTTIGNTPALIVTDAGNARVVDAIATLPVQSFVDAVDSVLLFDRDGIAFTPSHTPTFAPTTVRDAAIRISFVIGVFIMLLATSLSFVAGQARKAS